MENRSRHIHAAIVIAAFIITSFLFIGCQSQDSSFDKINLEFSQSKLYAELMESKQYTLIDSLGGGICQITTDSLFIKFPSSDIDLRFYKQGSEQFEDGTVKLLLKDGFYDVEFYMLASQGSSYDVELYAQDRLIKFSSDFHVVSTE